MAATSVDVLLDQLIRSWSGWETSRAFYLEILAPAIVRGDRSVANLIPNEQRLVVSLRALLSDGEWRELPQLLDKRESFLREEKLRREEDARLRPSREKEAKERLQAQQAALEARLREERQRLEEQRRREEETRRLRGQALCDRVSSLFESDFLAAEDAYGLESDQELLSRAEYEAMRTEFVKTWAQRELELELDDEQAAAVATVGRDARVTARAGSGKTRTLVTRAIFLIRHCGVAPRTVLLLAFNRRAAAEVRERLESALGAELPHVMTFHALAYALVHPEEALVYDDPGGDALALSRVIQDVIDEHLVSQEFARTIQGLMLEHFREDWEAIVSGGFNLGMRMISGDER